MFYKKRNEGFKALPQRRRIRHPNAAASGRGHCPPDKVVKSEDCFARNATKDSRRYHSAEESVTQTRQQVAAGTARPTRSSSLKFVCIGAATAARAQNKRRPCRLAHMADKVVKSEDCSARNATKDSRRYHSAEESVTQTRQQVREGSAFICRRRNGRRFR